MEQYLNKIINGNCLELVSTLEDKSIDAVVIDPPYGEGFDFEGDESITSAEALLSSFLGSVYPKLKPNAHLAIFWTMRNVDVCIDAVKAKYTFRRVLSLYIKKGSARPYLGFLPRTQAIVLGQKYLPSQPTDFHHEMTQYIAEMIDQSGYTRNKLAKELGCDSRLVMKWSRPNDPAWCLPTPRFYPKLKELLSLDDRYDCLLTREPSNRNQRKDFSYRHDCYVVDDKNEKMMHPAQKPLKVVKHLVECCCPKGGTVLDAFAGSGTVALAAKLSGRNFISFEINKHFCEIAEGRL